jgi:hypothetical protein
VYIMRGQMQYDLSAVYFTWIQYDLRKM